MSALSEKIQMTQEERDLILKYGYPEARLAKSLGRWPQRQSIRRISMSCHELEMFISELSRSLNHDETGENEDAVLGLCDRLEYAERTGDGDLDILW